MVKICRVKMDNRGRFSLPINFLQANNIKTGSYVSVVPVAGSTNVRLEFEFDDSDVKERKGNGKNKHK